MDCIILFDGSCNLCNNSVQFIIKRDKLSKFKFASLQGVVGQELLQTYQIDPNTDSFILIEMEKVYVKSSAALRVCKHLSGFWRMLPALLIVPSFMRDYIYDIVANNRYRWFGKNEHCLLPTRELRKRFLD